VVNSCSTPSILMLVTEAPGIEESSVRRSEFAEGVSENPAPAVRSRNRERLLGDGLLGEDGALSDKHDESLLQATAI